MINIKDIEEGVMIEVNDFNYPLSNLINDVKVSGRGLSREEVFKYASNIAASLYIKGYITFEKATYKHDDDGDSYTLVATRGCTENEIEYILKESERWDEQEIYSHEDVYELAVTEKGRGYLDGSY